MTEPLLAELKSDLQKLEAEVRSNRENSLKEQHTSDLRFADIIEKHKEKVDDRVKPLEQKVYAGVAIAAIVVISLGFGAWITKSLSAKLDELSAQANLQQKLIAKETDNQIALVREAGTEQIHRIQAETVLDVSHATVHVDLKMIDLGNVQFASFRAANPKGNGVTFALEGVKKNENICFAENLGVWCIFSQSFIPNGNELVGMSLAGQSGGGLDNITTHLWSLDPNHVMLSIWRSDPGWNVNGSSQNGPKDQGGFAGDFGLLVISRHRPI